LVRTLALDDVRIRDGHDVIEGDLRVPERAEGLVIFAHGSGSSRFSSRNRQVAEGLEQAGIATLLLDLLTRYEEEIDAVTSEHRLDIPMLARRVMAAADWAGTRDRIRDLPVGYFGASTGAAAAMIAAARRPELSAAVVSRGGRPDLAGETVLRAVQAPALLIVGGRDEPVIDLNEEAMRHMHGVVRLEIVPGATHLFSEPGALEEVTRLAAAWFERYFHTRQGLRMILDGLAPDEE
jgi:pimeloyl-ACP methyl ester carboxylesterase